MTARGAGPPGAADEVLRSAVNAHRAGRLQEADRLYRRLLEAHPDHAEALHLLGLVRHQGGRSEDAVGLIERAIACDAAIARYHNSRGVALYALGRIEAAEASYRRALTLSPDHVETLVNLANALKEQGRLDEAVACLERALELRPDYALAHNNLANVKKDRGAYEAAIEGYRQALALAPDYVEARHNLSVALLAQGRLDEAEESCREALALDPGYAPAHNNLGNVLRYRGRLEEAVACYREALAIDPGFASAQSNLVEFTTFEAGDPAFAALESLKAKGGLPLREATTLHFALGKVYADIGDYDRAFADYREGNALRAREAERTGRAFRVADHEKRISAIVAALARETLDRAAAGCGSDVPVFIVGMPRSGTTLVEQILASHAEVFGAGELPEIGRIAERLPADAGAPYPAGVAALDDAALGRLGEGYVERLRALAEGARRVTDKTPANFLHLGLIALMLPGARVIHCRRDPRDVCVSCYFHDFAQGSEFTDDLAALGRYYRLYEQLMAHWREVLPRPILDVDYEALVADQEGVSRQLVDFCGLEWDDACLAFHETQRTVRTSSDLQVRRRIFTSSIGRWRDYESHLGPLIEALGRDPVG
ncbi:MAG: sulfotransferase [Alphaproteobacteria bacterium]